MGFGRRLRWGSLHPVLCGLFLREEKGERTREKGKRGGEGRRGLIF